MIDHHDASPSSNFRVKAHNLAEQPKQVTAAVPSEGEDTAEQEQDEAQQPARKKLKKGKSKKTNESEDEDDKSYTELDDADIEYDEVTAELELEARVITEILEQMPEYEEDEAGEDEDDHSDEPCHGPGSTAGQAPGHEEAAENCSQIVRCCVEHMVALAHRYTPAQYSALRTEEQPYALSFYDFLRKVDVEKVLATYDAAIYPEVKALILKPEWTLADIDELVKVSSVPRRLKSKPGIYVNFPHGTGLDTKGAFPTVSQADFDVYGGSSLYDLIQRVITHTNISRKSVAQLLLTKHAKSWHYLQICRPNVNLNFRVMAMFEDDVEDGYVELLEAISMILFGSFNYSGKTHSFATKASYELVDTIRQELVHTYGLAEVTWHGLNYAWPCTQGIHIRSSNGTPLKCANTACTTITYAGNLPANAPKTAQRHPGGLCATCYGSQLLKGTLPLANQLAELNFRTDSRLEAGTNAECLDCKRHESDLPLHKITSHGNIYMEKRTFILEKEGRYKGKYLCPACSQRLAQIGRIRNPGELTQFLLQNRVRKLYERRKTDPTVVILCDHCGLSTDAPGYNRKHIANSLRNQMLCIACDMHSRNHAGAARPLELEAQRDLVRRMDAQRTAGNPPRCHFCNNQENVGAVSRGKGPRKFIGSKTATYVICANCYNKKGKR
jgi:hypothetical protein